VNFGHYPKIEHERFVNEPLSRFSSFEKIKEDGLTPSTWFPRADGYGVIRKPFVRECA